MFIKDAIIFVFLIWEVRFFAKHAICLLQLNESSTRPGSTRLLDQLSRFHMSWAFCPQAIKGLLELCVELILF